jgi:hypothetical protein
VELPIEVLFIGFGGLAGQAVLAGCGDFASMGTGRSKRVIAVISWWFLGVVVLPSDCDESG